VGDQRLEVDVDVEELRQPLGSAYAFGRPQGSPAFLPLPPVIYRRSHRRYTAG
jgi:hypothetical protein